eukprot:12010696-Ditylum_brightwellii.AAC.1
MHDNDDSSVLNNGSPSPGKTDPSGDPVESTAVSCHKKKRKRISRDPMTTAVKDLDFDLVRTKTVTHTVKKGKIGT